MGVAGRDWRGDWEKGVWLLLPRGEGVWLQLTLMNTPHDSLTHYNSKSHNKCSRFQSPVHSIVRLYVYTHVDILGEPPDQFR